MVSNSTWAVLGILTLVLFLLPFCFWSGLFSPQAQLDIEFNVAGVCGNGIVDIMSEECDLGVFNGFLGSGCAADCTLVVVPEKVSCEGAGGVWTLFGDSCVDSCDSQKLFVVQPLACSGVQTFGCSCVSVNECWDGVQCGGFPMCPQWSPFAPGWCSNPGDVRIPGVVVDRCQMPPSCLQGSGDPCDAVPELICSDGSVAPSVILTSPVGDPACVWEPVGCPVSPPGGGGGGGFGGFPGDKAYLDGTFRGGNRSGVPVERLCEPVNPLVYVLLVVLAFVLYNGWSGVLRDVKGLFGKK